MEKKIKTDEEIKKEVEQQTKDEDMKTKWHMAVKVNVESLRVETVGKNNEFVNRIRLFTDAGEITAKPRNEVTVQKEVGGMPTQSKKLELYNLSELLIKYPVLKALSDNCKEEPQEIVITYEESTNTTPVYRFMRAKSFETLYYAKFHKTSENLDKQNEYKESKKGKEI